MLTSPKRAPEYEGSTPVWARNKRGEPICGAKLRNKDSVCHRCRGLSAANGRCRQHGGFGSGAPTLYPQRSEALKKAGITGFDDVAADPEATANFANIATLEVMINEVFVTSTKPGAVTWKMALEAFGKGDLVELGAILQTGAGENFNREQSMERAARLLNEQRKHKAAEVKRLEVAANVLRGQDALDLIDGLYADICEVIKDQAILKQIGSRFAKRLPPAPSVKAIG